MRLHAPGVHEIHPFESLRAFGAELLRRRVIHTGVWYVGGCVAFLQGADLILSRLGVSTALLTPLLVLAIFGLPVALTLSWEFDVLSAARAGENARPAWLCLLPVLAVALVSALGLWLVWNYHFRRAAIVAAPVDVDVGKIAVMPFSTNSQNADLVALAANLQRQLIDGLTDAAQVKVAADRQLTVVSLDGVRPYADKPPDMIRRVLKVPIILAGDVESVGDAVRVHLRLVDTGTSEQLAHKVAQKNARQNIALSEALGDSALSLVRQELGVILRTKMRRIGTKSDAAFSLYQLAMRRSDDANALLKDSAATKGAFDEADGFLANAEKLDPHWVDPVIARAELAIARYINESGFVPRREGYLAAGMAHANQALHMSPNHYHALEIRGRLYYLTAQQDTGVSATSRAARTRGFHLAKQDLLRSLTSNPTPANCYRVLSEVASREGQMDEALRYARSAFDEDPYLDVRPIVLLRLFEYSIRLNRDAEAERWCREGRTRFTNVIFDDCRLVLAAWTRYGMRPDSAATLAQHALSIYPGQPSVEFRMRLAGMYAAILVQNHQRDSARAVLGRALHNNPSSPGALASAAGVYALLGINDSALIMAKRLLDHTKVEDRGVLVARPELRPLRSNASFQRLLMARD